MLNLLLIATYFSHFSSYTLLMFVLTFLAGVVFLKHLFQWCEHLIRLLQFIGYLVPTYFILFNTFLSNPEQRQADYQSFAYLWDYFINVKSLVYFNNSYLPFSWILIIHIGKKRTFEVRYGFLLYYINVSVLLAAMVVRPSCCNQRTSSFVHLSHSAWLVRYA